ncbi:hypothetical protein [Candidatus Chloroploca sp. Khr17]|uniref:hypothetical protein n=1 Tax=Candidatus Chloroploca sp. Khr17 TaxID=2496869 RepID=UPI00101C96D8|nr:hypothetical protein [Candidatus Chloroploca sp. Khr17]
MSVPLRLADILPKGDAALQALSQALAQQVFVLDWTEVATITPAQLDALFAAVPATWGFVEFAEVLDTATLQPTVAEQLSAWVEDRQVSGFRFQVSDPTADYAAQTPDSTAPDVGYAAQTPDTRHLTPDT